MIYRRAFIREALAQSALVLCLLAAMLFLIVTARALSDLAETRVAAGELLLLVLLGMMRYAPLLLSFSLAAGLLVTFDRMRSDRELLFWKVAGLRAASWLAPALTLAIPLSAFCAYMALEGSPWATRAVEKIKRQAIDRAEVVGHAGSFGEIGRLGIIYHITGDRTVLIQQQETHNRIVLAKGRLENAEGSRSLALESGRMYSAKRDSADVHDLRFDEGRIALGTPEEVINLKLKASAARDLDLSDRRHQAELHWRLSLPLSLIAIAMLITLSMSGHGSQRARGASILIAVAGYWFFYSLLSLAKELSAQAEGVHPAALVHAPSAFLLTLVALAAYLQRRKGSPTRR